MAAERRKNGRAGRIGESTQTRGKATMVCKTTGAGGVAFEDRAKQTKGEEKKQRKNETQK